ncbi:MAG TPA: hypothetical protein VG826_21765 [Pirellulales bacterium]|nr:hypothetical protein [Pirellulales bacterium]
MINRSRVPTFEMSYGVDDSVELGRTERVHHGVWGEPSALLNVSPVGSGIVFARRCEAGDSVADG